MNHLTKKIIYIFVAIISLGIFYFLFFGNLFTNTNDESLDRDNGLASSSNRDFVIQEALTNSNSLRQTKYNGDTYLLTGYAEDSRGNKPDWYSGGILIFKLGMEGPILFWESSEIISDGKYTYFKDIDNDGVNELVWEHGGPTGRDSAFYVYKFMGDKFKLITPVLPNSRNNYVKTALAGVAELTYMKDADGDKV